MHHTCNRYCAPPEHCDLVYAPASASAETVMATLWWGEPPLWATRAEPAREPPPLAMIPPAARDSHGLRPVRDDEPHQAWLVWWIDRAEWRRRREAEAL
ncbi:MAG: hypothetical protein KatS3mg060_1144 [Dehalococcoidia bacterium]|nr:MAG: hypothetical protein KatS3mg060_1144 [Dehalococcoidia bacterium]